MSSGTPWHRVLRAGWPVALLASGLVALALGWMPPDEVRIGWWTDLAVPIVATAALLALALLGVEAIALARRRPPLGARAPDAMALLALLALALLLWRSVTPEMRIQNDESLLVGASFGLHLTGKPLVPIDGYYDAGGLLHPLTLARDQRGVLFPMALGAMHAAFGYSPRHGVALNALLLFAIPILVYLGLRRSLSAPLAFAGSALALAHPVLIWTGASSGFEPINLVLLLACWLAAQAAKGEAAPRRWLLLALLGALASQARYESALFGAAMLLLAARGCWTSGSRPFGCALAAIPLLYLPFAWQRAAPFVHGLDQIDSDRAFGLDFLARNLWHAARFFAWPSGLEPLGPLVLALALLLAFVVWTRRLPDRTDADPAVNRLLVAATLVSLGPILGHAWGNLGDALTTRLGLPLMLLLSILAAGGLAWLCGAVPWRARLAAVACGALCLSTIPAVRADYGGHRQLQALAQNATLEWAHGTAGRCRPLFVEQGPPYFILHGYSAASPRDLQALWPRVREWARDGSIDGVWMPRLTRAGAESRGLPGYDVPQGFRARELAGSRRTLGDGTGMTVVALDRDDAPLGRDCAP